MQKRIDQFIEVLEQENIDGFIVPSVDEFQSEFCPDHSKRLQWLTGFTGSNGIAVILRDRRAFFTDGRYMVQSENEIDSSFKIYNVFNKTPYKWIEENAGNAKICADPWLHTKNQVENFRGVCDLCFCQENLIDKIWSDKPNSPIDKIKIYPEKYAGESHLSKINKISKSLVEKDIDVYVISSPESLCWLLNIRANDVPNTPLILSHAILYADKSVKLFIEENRIDEKVRKYFGDLIESLPPSNLSIEAMKLESKKVLIDKDTATFATYEIFDNSEIIIDSDPCLLPKACKNETEVNYSNKVHIYDGLALTKFLYWLDKKVESGSEVSEILIDEKLIEFRNQNSNFKNPSFDTIAGFKEHGAIIHYRANEQTAKEIQGNGLLLIDSGGQYIGGTTDITRTIAIGEPTEEQIRNFTLVLKGHIALATAVFPMGTTGTQLDVLARQYLWQNGLDYDHGTGHGVGSYLSVHEGPQRISKVSSNITLKAGMIISNEPGFYKEGGYGIRIENLVLVKEKQQSFSNRKFLYFETLSKVPMDNKLIDKNLLSDGEIKWLNNYHKQVWHEISSDLNEDECLWLKKYSM